MTTDGATGSPRRWLPPPADAEARAAALRADLPGLPEPLSRVLVARGIEGDGLRSWLRPSLDDLHDPLRLPDLPQAVARLEAAIAAGELIFVHGDFDADGMSATALAVRGLRRLGGNVLPYVPHRTKDGYDLRPEGVRRAAVAGATLILTVDCGVTALEAVAEARRLSIDVIVTDHHRPGPVLPDAVAVVNPVRADSTYPFEGLAGVGVAFKLVAALFLRAGVPDPELFQHLDLVAIGTVADQMPLQGENRTLVRAGLRALARTRKPGVRALLHRAKVDTEGPIRAADIAFRVGPRLNAVGRMAAAEAGVRLLLTDDPSEAEELADHLDEQNTVRRVTDRQVTEDVERLLGARDPAADGAVVVWGDDWHNGVVGIVASRLVDRWQRPAVVVSFDGDVGVGSGRSVDGFHLVEALRECGALLEGFGGHSMAAGLQVRRDRIEEFAARLRGLAATRLEEARELADLAIDLEVELSAVTGDLADALRHMGPYGNANPEPMLAALGVEFEGADGVGPEGVHLRTTLRDGPARLRAIGFGLGSRLPGREPDARYDVAFHLERDVWRGRPRLQARIVDFRPAGG